METTKVAQPFKVPKANWFQQVLAGLFGLYTIEQHTTITNFIANELIEEIETLYNSSVVVPEKSFDQYRKETLDARLEKLSIINNFAR